MDRATATQRAEYLAKEIGFEDSEGTAKTILEIRMAEASAVLVCLDMVDEARIRADRKGDSQVADILSNLDREIRSSSGV